MKQFDIHVAYIAWGDTGKRRPALIFSDDGDFVSVFGITTQFNIKSPAIRANYIPIDDWEFSGLSKPSYTDINTINEIPKAIIDVKPIGKLSEKDKKKLTVLLNSREL